jgi:hypothetical protein
MKKAVQSIYIFSLAPLLIIAVVAIIFSAYFVSNRSNKADVFGVTTDPSTSCVPATGLIKNGGFEEGKLNWNHRSNGGNSNFSITSNDELTDCPSTALIRSIKSKNDPSLVQNNILVEADSKYELSFYTRSNKEETLLVNFRKLNASTSKYDSLLMPSISVPLTTTYETKKISFETPASNSTPFTIQLEFRLPNNASTFIDNVLLEKISDVGSENEPSPPTNPGPVAKDTTVMNKKAYVIIFDPYLKTKNGMKLSEYARWKPYSTQVQEAINFFDEASEGTLKFNVVETREINDKWLVKEDGFTYTEEQYLNVIENGAEPHRPDIADYYQFLNDTSLDICGKYNRGEIDELWLFAGPWFGFYESAMATKPEYNGFYVNGPTFNKTTCNGLLPVGIPNAHTFGHRLEGTISYVFGGWNMDNNAHRWNWYGFNRLQSPQVSSYGCGSVHYAPNSRTGADEYVFWINDSVNSYCEAYGANPTLSLAELQAQAKPVSCATWGCNVAGYEMWWWKNIPRHVGVGPEGKLNNWWKYTFEPNMLLPNPDITFSEMRAEMPENGPAKFYYKSSSPIPGTIKVHASTDPNMVYDIYWNFAGGNLSPITVADPKKWGKYECGRILYWRLESEHGNKSGINATTVCM